MRHRLRLFTGEDSPAPVEDSRFSVRVRLGEISNALLDAVRGDRAWLEDFADDEVAVSADLFEVLSAYRRYRPGA